MKREQERDRKFEVMWNELQIAIKGLAALENRSDILSTLAPFLPNLLSDE
jgi:hypothetical protein